jgi:hypothetical protein
LEKWKIPSCISCNREYGALENELLLKLGLCLNPNALESEGIVDKVLRSLDPHYGRDDRDSKARHNKRASILARVISGEEVDPAATYPGLSSSAARAASGVVAIKFSRKAVNRLFEKIVRGLTYLENGRFIERSHVINIFPPKGDVTPLTEALDLYEKQYARGPGIVVRKALAADDGVSAIYEISIWGVFKTYASVTAAET